MQYLLYTGIHCCTLSGAYDFTGGYQTLPEAKAAKPRQADWAHIAHINAPGTVLAEWDEKDGWSD